jgi:hypothetical protein
MRCRSGCRSGASSRFAQGLLAEIPATVFPLEVARVRVEVRAMKVTAIAVPSGAPRWWSIGRRVVIARRRWRRRCHVNSLRCERTADHSAYPQSKKACAYCVPITRRRGVGNRKDGKEANCSDGSGSRGEHHYFPVKVPTSAYSRSAM